jgi:transketolase
MNLLSESVHERLTKSCHDIRLRILNLAFTSGGGQHLGGGLSMVEIMVYLYGNLFNTDLIRNCATNRDRFVLSKGHGVLGFYPVLHYFGLISDEILSTYKCFGSELISHPIKNISFGIESSNGSLGHGLSYAAGIAHGLTICSQPAECVVLLGDGECNEGSVWEAAMSAASMNLANLTAIVDFNGFQSDGSTSDILSQANLVDRWNAFGWNALEIDGHSLNSINEAFHSRSASKPNVLIANTIKGKGIDFMESNNDWHHGILTKSLYDQAIEALTC